MFTNPFAPRPPVRIKLREDSPSGVTLEGGDVLNPGEEKDVEFHLAQHLVVTGRAVVVKPPASVPDEVEEVDESESPVDVETRDPKAKRTR